MSDCAVTFCISFSKCSFGVWNHSWLIRLNLLTTLISYVAAKREKSSNGYLLIAASGGLNQQRTGVSEN